MRRSIWREYTSGQIVSPDFKPCTAATVVVQGRCAVQLPLTIAHEQLEQERRERAQNLVADWAKQEGLKNKVKSLEVMKDTGARMKSKWADAVVILPHIWFRPIHSILWLAQA